VNLSGSQDRDPTVEKKDREAQRRARVSAWSPAMSGSEVDSGDVLGLLGDEGVDDGVREGLASSSMWAAPSTASSGGAGTRL
jgi:hypothetical protein